MMDKEKLIHISLKLTGRNELDLKLWVNAQGVVERSELSGIGGPQALDSFEEWRPKLVGRLESLEIPNGGSPTEVLLREALLKVRGEWSFPVEGECLCYCRGVKTSIVDGAVIMGGHSPLEVSRQTSAGTGCGTCFSRIQEVIDYRLDRKKKLAA